MDKITKSFLALVLMLVGLVSAKAGEAPTPPAAPKASALVTDGSVDQYLFNVGAKGFFLGANDWGTRASIDPDKGYKVKITKNADGNTYTLNNEAKGGNSADCQGVDQIWVDGKGRAGDAKWTVTIAEDGSFKLGNTNVTPGFLAVVPSKNDTKLYISDAEEAQDVWIAVSVEDYTAFAEAKAKYKEEYAAWVKDNAKAGDDLIAVAPSTWEGQSGTYAGFGAASERYNGGSIAAGDVMTQTIEGLKNGKYEVKLELAGSYTSGRGFECPTGDGLAVAFANTQEENLPIVDRVGVGQGEQSSFDFKNVEVTDGVLKYGIKNLAAAGNWYVARVTSIVLTEVAPPAKDAWFNAIDFCFRDKASSVEANKSRTFAVWGADPDDETNGCIVATAGKNSSATNAQFWIRGAEYVEPTYIGEDKTQLTAVYGKGGFASGTGFKVTMRVKADGEYSAGSQTHSAFQHKSNDGFGTLKVTKEWQTVSFTCIATDALAGFTDLCFNLAASDADRTFYFDDIQITSGGPEWYVNTRITDKWKENGQDKNKQAEYKSDGYAEIVTVSNANTWDNQVFFQIADAAPNGKLKKNDKITLEFKAMALLDSESTLDKTEIQAGGGYHRSYDGAGWMAGVDGATIKVGDWADVKREITLDRDGVTNFSLDLSYDSKPITYRFKDVKVTYESGIEEWTEAIKFGVKVTPFTQDPADETKWVAGDDVVNDPAYKVVDGDGMFEVVVDGKKANAWDTQFFFQIADAAPSKALKMNDKVTLKYKIKAVSETLEEGTELSLGGNLHTACGSGWFAGAPAGKAVIGKWTDIEQLFEIGDPKTTNYSMNMSADANPITYYIDEVSVKFEAAPVLDWVELIPNGDCETAAEHAFAAAKEVPVDGSNVNKARIVDGVGKDGGKGIEVVAGAKVSQPWDNQFWIYEPYYLPAGTSIIVEFDYKADLAGSVGTQSHREPAAGNNYLHYIGIGNVSFTTEWQHFKYEGKIQNECDGKDDDGNAVARFLSFAFNLNDIADANKYYFDNLSFKVPADVISGKEPIYDVDTYKEVEYKDPATLDWTDNLFTNGDIEGDDVSAFYAKVNSDADGLILAATTKNIKSSNQIEVVTAAREKDPADETKYLGNDHDTQFFVRLPYALAKGTKYYFSVDYLATKVADVQSQTHAEPGEYKSNTGVGKITTGSTAQTLAGYFTADNDMRTLAFNLASATEGGKFYFDNFVFKVVKDDEAAIKTFTEEWDKTSLWDATFALNVAYDKGRNAETEGCTEASVKALTDAMAAGKAILQPAEGAEPATKDAIAAAAKAIEDAIAGLEKGGVIADCDLTADMFFTWDAVDATASKTGQAGCAYDVNKSTGMPYGDGSVNEYNFADLTAYDHLAITATEGEPRLLFNRAAQDDHQGPLSVELPRDFGQNKFEAIVDNGDGSKTYVINLKAITEKDGYAHLHAIKGANWANTTVTAMKLFVGASEYSDVLTNINGVEDGASVKDGKYFINGQIVIVKNGVKYNAAGVAIK